MKPSQSVYFFTISKKTLVSSRIFVIIISTITVFFVLHLNSQYTTMDDYLPILPLRRSYRCLCPHCDSIWFTYQATSVRYLPCTDCTNKVIRLQSITRGILCRRVLRVQQMERYHDIMSILQASLQLPRLSYLSIITDYICNTQSGAGCN